MFYELLASLEESERCFVNELYEKYNKKIYGIAFKIINNKHDAEDVVNTVFINVMMNLTKFMGNSDRKIKSQLVIYCKNAAIDVYRKNDNRSEKETTLVFSKTDENDEDIEIPDNGKSIDEILLSNELSDYVRNAMAKLSDADSDVIKLRCLLDYSSEEAAGILNISPNAVNKRLSKAKFRLAEILDEMYGGKINEYKK